jgi:hypothetical protein
MKTLEHPPYYPDPPPADFYLLPRMKSALKGRCFCDDTEIMKNVTEELKWFFKKWLLGMLPAPLQLLSEVYSCTRGLF